MRVRERSGVEVIPGSSRSLHPTGDGRGKEEIRYCTERVTTIIQREARVPAQSSPASPAWQYRNRNRNRNKQQLGGIGRIGRIGRIPWIRTGERALTTEKQRRSCVEQSWRGLGWACLFNPNVRPMPLPSRSFLLAAFGGGHGGRFDEGGEGGNEVCGVCIPYHYFTIIVVLDGGTVVQYRSFLVLLFTVQE